MSQLNVIQKPYRLFSLTWRSPFSKFSDDGKSQKGIRRKANGGDSFDEASEKVDRPIVSMARF